MNNFFNHFLRFFQGCSKTVNNDSDEIYNISYTVIYFYIPDLQANFHCPALISLSLAWIALVSSPCVLLCSRTSSNCFSSNPSTLSYRVFSSSRSKSFSSRRTQNQRRMAPILIEMTNGWYHGSSSTDCLPEKELFADHDAAFDLEKGSGASSTSWGEFVDFLQ